MVNLGKYTSPMDPSWGIVSQWGKSFPRFGPKIPDLENCQVPDSLVHAEVEFMGILLASCPGGRQL